MINAATKDAKKGATMFRRLAVSIAAGSFLASGSMSQAAPAVPIFRALKQLMGRQDKDVPLPATAEKTAAKAGGEPSPTSVTSGEVASALAAVAISLVAFWAMHKITEKRRRGATDSMHRQ